MDALKFGADAIINTLAGVPASEIWAIPVNSEGVIPRMSYIATDGGLFFLPASDKGDPGVPKTAAGDTTVTALTGVYLSSNQPLTIQSRGWTHLITIGETASELFCIAPVEN